MASNDHNRYDDSDDEDDFNPAPADLSDDEPSHNSGQRHAGSDARESSPAADDDDAAAAPKSRRVDDDEDDEQDDEEGGQNDDDEEDDEDEEDEDDVQQVSLPLSQFAFLVPFNRGIRQASSIWPTCSASPPQIDTLLMFSLLYRDIVASVAGIVAPSSSISRPRSRTKKMARMRRKTVKR